MGGRTQRRGGVAPRGEAAARLLAAPSECLLTRLGLTPETPPLGLAEWSALPVEPFGILAHWPHDAAEPFRQLRSGFEDPTADELSRAGRAVPRAGVAREGDLPATVLSSDLWGPAETADGVVQDLGGGRGAAGAGVDRRFGGTHSPGGTHRLATRASSAGLVILALLAAVWYVALRLRGKRRTRDASAAGAVRGGVDRRSGSLPREAMAPSGAAVHSHRATSGGSRAGRRSSATSRAGGDASRMARLQTV